jgi:hypothetical protein
MKNSESLLNKGGSERGTWDGVVEEPTPHQNSSGSLNNNLASFRPVPPVALGTNPLPWRAPQKKENELTPLALLVRERLAEMGVRQSEFCRLYRFDQGLLSKIQNSVITNLSLESVLRLAVGLAVPPQKILALIDRMDLHDLVLQAYSKELAAAANGRPPI